jgi:hypothetical protein
VTESELEKETVSIVPDQELVVESVTFKADPDQAVIPAQQYKRL